jgi:hypothetical protein
MRSKTTSWRRGTSGGGAVPREHWWNTLGEQRREGGGSVFFMRLARRRAHQQRSTSSSSTGGWAVDLPSELINNVRSKAVYWEVANNRRPEYSVPARHVVLPPSVWIVTGRCSREDTCLR